MVKLMLTNTYIVWDLMKNSTDE